MSRGSIETNQLRSNIEAQLNRLVTQLSDLEEMKDELEAEEYESTKIETINQLKEFQASLEKMIAGNISLVDAVGAVQLKIQEAISSSLKRNTDLSKHFEKGTPASQLRSKLSQVQAELSANRITTILYQHNLMEILLKLREIDTLNSAESTLFEKLKQEQAFQSISTETMRSH